MRFHKLSISVSETLNGMPCRQTMSRGGRVSMAHVSYRKHALHLVPSFVSCSEEHNCIRRALLLNLLAELHIKNYSPLLDPDMSWK